MIFDIYNSSETLMIKYYFALEHELPIARTGDTFTKVVDEIQHSVKGIPMYIDRNTYNSVHNIENPKKFYSLGFYQVPVVEMSNWESGVSAIHKALALQGNKKSQKFLDNYKNDTEVKQFRTVVSAVTILEPGKETFNEDNLPMSLIESINVLSNFIRALKLHTHYPYEVNQETLHSGVMRTAEILTENLTDVKIIDQRMISLREKEDIPVQSIDNQDFGSVVSLFLRNEFKDPILKFAEYKNRGKNDLVKDGLYSSACMNLGIASEVILSSALNLSLWEDTLTSKISNEDAAVILALPFAKRIKSTYPHRFGGNVTEMLNTWNAYIALPRHKVAHSGRLMTKSSANMSLSALSEVQKFINDVLVNKIAKYPRTALLLVDDLEFEARGKTKSANKYRQIFENSTPAENKLGWLKSYNQWMEEIEPLVWAKR